MNQFKLRLTVGLISFLFSFLCANLWAMTSVASQTTFELIRPNPADFSEVRAFHQEWCAANSVKTGSVRAVCFGEAVFQGSRSVRSVLLQTKQNQKYLYIESAFPGVDLLTLDFQIVGPVLSQGKESAPFSEMGDVHLMIDAQGEVMSVVGSTPRLGQLRALRP